MIAPVSPIAPIAPIAEAAEVPKNPYKFLDYFNDSPEDRRRFGGRDREVHDIVTRVTNERTLVLYGPSGIGKTSLLRAGVFPALEERQVRPVYARVLTSPLADLGQALSALPGETLRDTLARLAAAGPIVLFLDQFEELFIRFRDQPQVRAAFADALGEVVSDALLDVTVVFSLREDYLASLDELSAAMKDLLADRYRLIPLTAFGVRQAVTRPLVDAGIPFEPAVVSGLIRALEEVDFEPPVLQIFCSELYKEAANRAGRGALPRLTVADLERLGGSDSVFRRYLDGVAKALPTEWNLLARIVLNSLITHEGTKRASTLEDLMNLDFSAGEKEVVDILGLMVQHRLVRRQEKDREVWFELIHERLIPVVRDWLALDREFFQFRQARAFVTDNAASDLWQGSPDTLISAGALTNLIGPYRERFRFSQRERELLVRSAIYQRNSELSWWAELYGVDRTREILLKTLESGTEAERCSAVVSARCFKAADQDGRLAQACLRVTLDDLSEGTWREAALALADLARPEEEAQLKSAVEDPRRRARASLILAEMAGHGHGLKGFSWWQRRKARSRYRWQVVRDQRDLLIRRQWVGFKQGAWTGIVASILFQLPLIDDGSRLIGILYFPVVAFVGGAWGAMTANLAAVEAACRRVEGGWLASLKPFIPLLCFFSLILLGLPFFGASVLLAGLLLLLPVPVAVAVAVAVAQWTRSFVMRDSRKLHVFLRMLLVSVAIPAPLALCGLLLRVVDYPLVSITLLWISSSLCWLSFVAGMALVGSSLAHPFGEFLPARGFWARWAAAREEQP